MDFYDAQNQWGFPQSAAQPQQTVGPADWNAVGLSAPDAPDPLASLQNDTNIFNNFTALANQPTQYPPQQGQPGQPFFQDLFNNQLSWNSFPALNGASTQPQSPTVRITQQPQLPQQTMLHPGTTVDPATLLMQNSHYTQALHPYAIQAPAPFVNPSQLVQQQPQHQQPLSPPADASGNKLSLSDALKPLLSSKILENGGRSAVTSIVDTIERYGGPADVEPRVRLEIMSRIRDNAGDEFREAWANHPGAMEIIRSWLKAGISGKGAGSDESNDGLIALLHVINRLPLTVELLKETKLGRYIKHLMKEPPSNAIKSVAHELEKSWREIVRRAEAEGMPDHDKAEADTRGRKRKLTEAGAARDAPPAKKAAIASSTAKVIVKKETKAGTTSTTVVSAKSDSSFFSAPKAKPKLPNFKKAPTASTSATAGMSVKPEPTVAQPMSIDPFQDAMKSLNRGRFGSPAQSGTPPSTSVAAASSSLPDANKKKKRVVFAPEHELRKIKYIERAVYDDDPADGAGTGHNVRDLDRAEGAAMHKYVFEELIDWYEPYVVDLTLYANVLERGSNSQEKFVQEERELKTLAALYQTPDAVPPSPAEPAWVPDDGPEPQIMMAGVDLDGLMNSAPPPSVPDLLSDLAATVPVPTPVPVVPEPEPMPAVQLAAAASATGYIDPDLVARITKTLAAANGQAPGAAPAPAAPALPPPLVYGQPSTVPPAYPPVNPWDQPQQPVQPQADHVWNLQPTYGQQQQHDGGQQWHGQQQGWRGGRGGGGRGRGRGGGNWNNGKKRCNFFAAGRCRYGDQCDYAHERD
ncbi:hypothetical protein AURDEDRAFT_110720 [Auricularia subglabra TFB-10046 SS5]|nr:hypothetical protein AURDEDRAFT_110720 [Auricularia subglabra TFB-10046 SS5]